MRKKIELKAGKRPQPEKRPDYRTVLIRTDLYERLLMAAKTQKPTMGPNLYLEKLLAEHLDWLDEGPPAGRKM